MFNIVKDREFDFPVVIKVPNGATAEGAPQFDEETISVRFREQSSEALARLVRESDSDTDFLTKVVCGWSGVGRDGNAVPFSAEALSEFLSIPYVVNATTDAYMQAMRGSAERHRGNSGVLGPRF